MLAAADGEHLQIKQLEYNGGLFKLGLGRSLRVSELASFILAEGVNKARRGEKQSKVVAASNLRDEVGLDTLEAIGSEPHFFGATNCD